MNNNKERVLRTVFTKPTYKFHIRELAELTSLNPNTVISIVDKSVKEGLLVKEKRKHLTEVYLNFENPKAVTAKRLFNLSEIYNSGIVEFLAGFYNPEAISAIGSYSKGEDIEKSDIDIVVISNKKETLDVEKYEKRLSRKIHLLVLNYNKMSDEFYTNLINGVILYGYIIKNERF